MMHSINLNYTPRAQVNSTVSLVCSILKLTLKPDQMCFFFFNILSQQIFMVFFCSKGFHTLLSSDSNIYVEK